MCITICPVVVTHTVTTTRLYDLWVKQHAVGLNEAEEAEADELIYDEAYIQAMETDGDHLHNYFIELATTKFYDTKPD